MNKYLQLDRNCELYKVIMYHFNKLDENLHAISLQLKGDGSVTVHYVDENNDFAKWHINIIWAVQNYARLTRLERQLAREQNETHT